MNRRAAGRYFEEKCCAYLKARGYEILEQNFTVRGGEIDIVAKKGDIISFVEVKARSARDFALPREAVGPQKRRRMILAANAYIVRRNPVGAGFSFDVMEVLFSGAAGEETLEINHIADAFLVDGGER